MTITDTQLALADGALLSAAMLGIGGDRWTVSRGGGNGITGASAPVAIGVWQGYVKRSKATQIAPASPTTPVAVTEYHALGISDQVDTGSAGGALVLRVGDLLTSIANQALNFRIDSPFAVAGYVRYILAPAPPRYLAPPPPPPALVTMLDLGDLAGVGLGVAVGTP